MFKEVHVHNIERRAGAPQITELLAHYRSLCYGGAIPSYDDFNPARFPQHASNLAVVEPVGDDDYLYIHYGRTIFETSGIEMLGSKVSQWKSQVGTFFCQAYDRATAELRPIYTVHRAHHAIRIHLWERLVLPVRAKNGSVRLVVFSTPREYVDDLLRAVLDASPDGVLGLRCMRNADGYIEDALVISVNQHAADFIGSTIENLIDHSILHAIPSLRGSNTWARYLEVVETRQPQRFELALNRGDRTTWLDVKAVPLGDGFVLSIADITSLKDAYRELEVKNFELGEEVSRRQALECELRRLAEVDVLTGVATRRAFMDAANRALAVASGDYAASIIAVDVDHFKAINDRYGHLSGDKILIALGEVLRSESRAHDVVGRLGGEEFAILLPRTSLEKAVAVAERIRERLHTTVVQVGEATGISMTASFGVATFVPGDTYEDFLGRADCGLYRAKNAGRDTVVAAQSDRDEFPGVDCTRAA